MTQLIILGAIVTGFAALYMYVSNNKESFVKKSEPPKDPFDVIYLPADLDSEKDASEQKQNEQNQEEEA